MSLNPLFVEAVALAGPGLDSWSQSRDVLAGKRPYQYSELKPYKPQLLPPNERRRATALIRLAFQVCEQAVTEVSQPLDSLAAVFASSGGDYQIIDQICRTLATAERAVSPTQFHNSVHNAAAGYWSIASGSRAPSVSLSAFDATFAQGLLEAAMMAGVEKFSTLLAVYDTEPPLPLKQKRPIAAPFGFAFLLSPEKTPVSMARLSVAVASGQIEEHPAHCAELEALRLTNPAARAIPLLELLAKNSAGSCAFNLPGGQHVSVGVATVD